MRHYGFVPLSCDGPRPQWASGVASSSRAGDAGHIEQEERGTINIKHTPSTQAILPTSYHSNGFCVILACICSSPSSARNGCLDKRCSQQQNRKVIWITLTPISWFGLIFLLGIMGKHYRITASTLPMRYRGSKRLPYTRCEWSTAVCAVASAAKNKCGFRLQIPNQ